jgi:acetyltransferase-like isoleucine patch superfamily enzyme
VDADRTLPGDWHPGTIPANVLVDPTAYVETTYSFLLYRSAAPIGVSIGKGASAYKGVMFDVGAGGRVIIGDYALIHGARVICDERIEVGDHTLISWNVVLMDSYRLPVDPAARREALRRAAATPSRRLEGDAVARPVRIGPNAWIGFDACVLPGVTVGEGAIVGARSVVTADVQPYTIVAGNPATVIRSLDPGIRA